MITETVHKTGRMNVTTTYNDDGVADVMIRTVQGGQGTRLLLVGHEFTDDPNAEPGALILATEDLIDLLQKTLTEMKEHNHEK